MVCRAWAKICRPAVFNAVTMDTARGYQDLQQILRTLASRDEVGIVLRELDIGPWKSLTNGETMPSLSLSLAMYGRWLHQLACLGWAGSYWRQTPDGARSLQPAGIRHAPPRVEAALSSLLRSLRGLTRLSVSDMQFKSFTQLLRVLRAIPLITHIWLSDVTVLHAPEHLHWPKSAVLTTLGYLGVKNCNIPLHTLPLLVSLGICGTPNLNVSSFESEQHSMSEPVDGVLHPDQERTLLRIATLIAHFLPTLSNHSPIQHISCVIRRDDHDNGNFGETQAILSRYSTTRA